MKGWNNLKSSGRDKSSVYIKLETGMDCVVHLIDKEPEMFRAHAGKGVFGRCTGIQCPHCANKIPVKDRWAINVYNFKEQKIMIYEGGFQVFSQIAKLNEAYEGDLSNVDFKIIKEGTGLNTSYTVVPMVPSKFSDEMIKDLNPHNLAEIYGKDVVEIEEEDKSLDF